ncbi:MAG: hypothetical protein Q4F54_02705 [Coriobacteriia bacterium]|nr:hypothetical protein [Coriobacteriia bacterium]
MKAAIPQAHIEEVEKQISYNNEYRRYINQIRIEKHNRVKTCTKWSTIFSIVGAVLLILLAFSSNLSSDLFVNSQFWSCTYGTLLFSLIGGISIGYIIGCLPLSTIKDGMAFTLSSLLGLFTSIICPVCPPISLILA